ncbi:unnamed protein product [Xylocopa violacea]|uniref:G-protein coupled receptors family 2 profile 2 domain-containing protein n=3 Tax=Xylocopa violacea TaxID=135666 RepID=A0ABP1P9S0_XYLVO
MIHSRHSGMLPSKGLLWITILTCMISSSWAFDIHCCPDGMIWLHGINCSDDTKVRLECEFGGYLVDPDILENDKFVVVEKYGEPWLQFVTANHIKIPKDSFCVANRENGSSPVAMVCFNAQEVTTDSITWKNTLFTTLGIISVVFLIATLAVYVLLPELREIQDKAMMAAVTSLTVSYIILSIQNLRHHKEEDDIAICLTLAFILYFAFMSVFFWLNIVSFNIWRTVWFKQFTIADKTLFNIYCMVGWGGPTCFLIVTLITHHIEGTHLKPGFGLETCWFHGPVETWAYFYGPIAILLTLNTIYLGLTSWRLWHEYRDCNGSNLRALRFKCLLYVKLIFVMGITWIFEVLSFADPTKNDLWIPTDILNSLQGLIIFLLLVAMRKRVRKLLAKKRPCGISFPKSWTAYEDEECEEVLPEEVELSQQA